jgi:uncharacterized membrane protein YozB (DUF420 family)
MHTFLVYLHSGLRWVALLLLVYAILNAIAARNSSDYTKKDKMINLFTMVSLHLQLVIGLVLYFISEKRAFIEGWIKNDMYRFYNLEHISLMIIAIALVTFARGKAERSNDVSMKHKKIRIWYTVALILILASIPWPFRENLGVDGWF